MMDNNANYVELFEPILANARKAYEEGKVIPTAYEFGTREKGDDKWACCAIGACAYELGGEEKFVEDVREYRFGNNSEVRYNAGSFSPKQAATLTGLNYTEINNFTYGFDAGHQGSSWEDLCKARSDLLKGPAKVGFDFGVEIRERFKK